MATDLDTEALILAAEEAEADAEAAEAAANAARARARAARLRHAVTLAGRSDDPGETVTATVAPAVGTAVGDTVTDSAATRDRVADAGAPTGPRRRTALLRRISPRVVAVVAGVAVIVAALVVGGLSLWHQRGADENDRRAAEFTAAARQGVIALTSLDFNHAKEDVQRVLDESTGSFHDDFQGRSADFVNVIQQSKVSTEGKVTAAAVESMTDDSAVLLVAATSQVTNAAGAKQEPRVWRLSVTVSRAGGKLMMSKVEFVP